MSEGSPPGAPQGASQAPTGTRARTVGAVLTRRRYQRPAAGAFVSEAGDRRRARAASSGVPLKPRLSCLVGHAAGEHDGELLANHLIHAWVATEYAPETEHAQKFQGVGRGATV
jgi:hypothetical protein